MKLNKAAKKLAHELGLSEVDAALMELKSKLYENCARSIKASGHTHSEIAQLVGTSRARITRLSNLGEASVSLELLIKIVTVLEDKMPIEMASGV